MKLSIYIVDDTPKGFKYTSNTIVTVVNNTYWLLTACIVTDSSELSTVVMDYTCTALNYTITFPKETSGWCELFLKGFNDITDIYYIKALSCPTCFTLINGICQCYPLLYQYGITCNINDQTLLRPTNT